MNEQKAIVLIDSGCDVPAHMREKLNIRILPLRVMYPEKDYMDGIDIDPMMVYQRFPDEFPSTSTPSYSEVVEVLEGIRDEGYEHVIAITISSGLSGTYNTIRLVGSEFEGLEVWPFDSRNISIGGGLFAIWAATQLQNGMPLEEIKRQLRIRIKDVKVFFYMDTLKYLQRGGRIGGVASFVGEALKLKPIISCNDEGTYYTVAKIRGAKFGKLRLFEEVVKFSLGHKTWAVIEEGDAHTEMLAMKKLMEEHGSSTDTKILFEQQITATMAINTGPGLVGVGVMRDPDKKIEE